MRSKPHSLRIRRRYCATAVKTQRSLAVVLCLWPNLNTYMNSRSFMISNWKPVGSVCRAFGCHSSGGRIDSQYRQRGRYVRHHLPNLTVGQSGISYLILVPSALTNYIFFWPTRNLVLSMMYRLLWQRTVKLPLRQERDFCIS